MIKILLELVGTTECADIQAEIFLDNKILGRYSCSLNPYLLELSLTNDYATHVLRVKMSGKTYQHTVVADDGSIESDASISISRLEFEDIDMMPIFCQGATCYMHNYNDATRPVELDEFYGYIGCNGTVDIEFETPMYLWFNKHF